MKTLRLILFVAAAIFAPLSAKATDVTVSSAILGGQLKDCHPTFTNGALLSFTLNRGTSPDTFVVTLDKYYRVTAVVGGVITTIGKVKFTNATTFVYEGV